MVLKYYYDLMSQPSRALYIFLKLNKVTFEPRLVRLQKGEHLSDEFKQEHSRFQKIPFIHDGTFKLNESIAILRYVVSKYGLDTKWYPKDLEKRARIDEYLEWQHSNTRFYCATYFMKKFLYPLITGQEASAKVVQKAESDMVKCLDNLEELWLNHSDFIAGNEISVADIFAVCEIEQPRMAGFEPTTNRPILKKWMENVRKETNPFYDEAHVIIQKVQQKRKDAKL